MARSLIIYNLLLDLRVWIKNGKPVEREHELVERLDKILKGIVTNASTEDLSPPDKGGEERRGHVCL